MQIWFGYCCREVPEMPGSDMHERAGGRKAGHRTSVADYSFILHG